MECVGWGKARGNKVSYRKQALAVFWTHMYIRTCAQAQSAQKHTKTIWSYIANWIAPIPVLALSLDLCVPNCNVWLANASACLIWHVYGGGFSRDIHEVNKGTANVRPNHDIYLFVWAIGYRIIWYVSRQRYRHHHTSIIWNRFFFARHPIQLKRVCSLQFCMKYYACWGYVCATHIHSRSDSTGILVFESAP